MAGKKKWTWKSILGGLLIIIGLDFFFPPYPSSDISLLFILEQFGFILSESTFILYLPIVMATSLVMVVAGFMLMGIPLRKIVPTLKKEAKDKKIFITMFLILMAILIVAKVGGVFSIVGEDITEDSTQYTFNELMQHFLIASVGSVMSVMFIKLTKLDSIVGAV